jgi:hypothetical protein
MIKFKALGKDNKEIIGMGLSLENIDRLKNNKPIIFDGKDIGEPGKFFYIFFGETEEKMKDDLSRHFDGI